MPRSLADLACACQHDRLGVSERFRRPHRPGDVVAEDSGGGRRWGTDYSGTPHQAHHDEHQERRWARLRRQPGSARPGRCGAAAPAGEPATTPCVRRAR